MSSQTHNVAVVEGVASYVIFLGQDGRITNQGKWSRVAQDDAALRKELEVTQGEFAVEIGGTNKDTETKKLRNSGQGKLVAPEEIAKGHVSRNTGDSNIYDSPVTPRYLPDIHTVKAYFSDLNGGHPFLFWGIVIVGILLCDASTIAQPYWLGHWAQQFEGHDRSSVSNF